MKLWFTSSEEKDARKLLANKQKVSLWIEQRLLERISRHEDFSEFSPILLGSWARRELCPKSDVDVLFLNSAREREILRFANAMHLKSIPLRYRVVESVDNWCLGVESPDIIALLDGKAWRKEDESALKHQQERIAKGRIEHLAAMIKERSGRILRHSQGASFLEPNLKYGPGGLRDIGQALTLHKLFPERFPSGTEHQLKEIKNLLLRIRCALQLLHGNELLSGGHQLEIIKWLGKDLSFLKEMQMALSEAQFLVDYAFARCRSQKRLKPRHTSELNLHQAFERLKKENSLETQRAVYHQLKTHAKKKKLTGNERRVLGKNLKFALNANTKPDLLNGLYRSGWLEHAIPEFARVKGHVQFDHYHRLTVDAHTVQALVQIKKIYKNPNQLGTLKSVVRSLKSRDWRILEWTALFHDLTKGRPGDHSKTGAKLVEKELMKLQFSKAFAGEVSWMVENHLLLSKAAFRQNPWAKSTWESVTVSGVHGPRIQRLAVFTAIDIIATNPEAWTPWKERLLRDTVEALTSDGAKAFRAFLNESAIKKLLAKADMDALDPFLISSIRPKRLATDLSRCMKAKKIEPVLFLHERGKVWVRFHRRTDEPGLFLRFAQTLYALGCQIEHSAIATLKAGAVYDWFQVKTRKPISQLKKLLAVIDASKIELPKVTFDHIELISQNDEELTLSFRGRDQRGALLVAAKSLFDLGLVLKSAQVHTWGGQIDDVFCLRKPQTEKLEIHRILKRLEAQLLKSV